jgi:uncharacterized protein YecT (DUF1311 family)
MRGVLVTISSVPSSALVRTILLLVIAAWILGVASSDAMAQSGPAQLSADYRKCLDAPNQTNYGFDQCAQAEIKRQSERLDQAWATLKKEMHEYGAAGDEALDHEQQAWVKFRDASCQFFYSGDFGREGKTYHFGMCKANVIADRVSYLNTLIEFLKARRVPRP